MCKKVFENYFSTIEDLFARTPHGLHIIYHKKDQNFASMHKLQLE